MQVKQNDKQCKKIEYTMTRKFLYAFLMKMKLYESKFSGPVGSVLISYVTPGYLKEQTKHFLFYFYS